MKAMVQEFKSFAMKGSLVDLAVAVVIGGAFGAMVTSLVKNVIMPAVSYVMPGHLMYQDWHIGRIMIGAFLGDVVNFFITALAVFVMIVKVYNALTARRAASTPTADPVTRECPYCLNTIPIKAVRCGHCTSDLREAVITAPAAASTLRA